MLEYSFNLYLCFFFNLFRVINQPQAGRLDEKAWWMGDDWSCPELLCVLVVVL